MENNKMEKLFGYSVDIEQSCYSEYDGTYVSYINTLTCVKICDNDIPDVLSYNKFIPGDECFIVWVEWSTADSYGSNNNDRVESIFLLKNEKEALQLKNTIWLHYNKHNEELDYDNSAFNVILEDEKIITVKPEWIGYFETLESVNVEKIVIKNNF